MASNTNTLFPLGTMSGGPNGSDAAAQARFEAQFSDFAQLMGTTPKFMNAFVDPAQPITSWAANASWTAWSWAQSPLARGMTPVIGLPMATEADRGHPGAVYKAFASGQYDAELRGIVQSWAGHGFDTLYIRPGYEMNGTFMAWYAGDDAETQADWVAAFRHIADVLHAAPGADVKVIWNPNVQSWNGDLDVKTLYPGDSYVDLMGADLYSPIYPRDLYSWSRDNGTVDASFEEWAADPVNRKHYWDFPAANQWHPENDGQGNSLSLQDMIDFAKAHGKPLALAETGAGGDGDHGPTDDPAFPEWLSAKLAASGADIAMVNIWNVAAHDADWTFSGANSIRPLEAAAWSKFFGAGSAGMAPVIIGSGPDSIVLSVSEDAYQGDAQFTVRVDGNQIGGVQTADASHGAGQTQDYTVLGDFGAGAHTVDVTFLNDAYAGTASTDRNLYVDSITHDGTTTTTNAALLSNGTQAWTVGAAGPLTIGSGSDSMVLSVSEDAYQGDAQFTVSVDGKPVGGIQTATASHGAGRTQAYTLLGTFAAGSHTVDVTFLNDAYGGTASTDRNLYVDSISSSGSVTAGAAMMGGGMRRFAVITPDTVAGSARAMSFVADGNSAAPDGTAGAAQLVDGTAMADSFSSTATAPAATPLYQPATPVAGAMLPTATASLLELTPVTL